MVGPGGDRLGEVGVLVKLSRRRRLPVTSLNQRSIRLVQELGVGMTWVPAAAGAVGQPVVISGALCPTGFQRQRRLGSAPDHATSFVSKSGSELS